jgi:hypothetical protein
LAVAHCAAPTGDAPQPHYVDLTSMESLRALGLVGQDVQEEQENVVNFEVYLPPDGEQLSAA